MERSDLDSDMVVGARRVGLSISESTDSLRLPHTRVSDIHLAAVLQAEMAKKRLKIGNRPGG